VDFSIDCRGKWGRKGRGEGNGGKLGKGRGRRSVSWLEASQFTFLAMPLNPTAHFGPFK